LEQTVDLAIDARQSAAPQAPDEIQFMPPGRHRIHAHQGGKPATVEVEIGPQTAEVLQQALAAAHARAEAGQGDRPYFDLNHEDREAAGWPLEFRWAGDDPVTGGVRARVDWSEAGRQAISGRTFRRFSPSFFVSASKVTGAPLNMGGLVNRAAFSTIQPLFARASEDSADPLSTPSPMSNIANTLHRIGILSRVDADESAAIQEAATVLAKLRSDLDAANTRVAQLEKERTDAIRAKAQQRVIDAVKAGRIAPTDTESRKFWEAALVENEQAAVHALESIQPHSVLSRITPSDDGQARPRDLMAAQQKKLAEVRAAQPEADFATIFAKAAAESPKLFS
jgi:hypothetical protein